MENSVKYVISVDLGATNVRVALVSSSLDIITVFRERTTKNDKVALGNQIIRMIKSLPLDKYNVDKVGVSACGLIEKDHIDVLPNLNIRDFDLKKLIKDELNLDCSIANDANATALSEATFGASKNYYTSYFVAISSGIGGCLVNKHQLVDLPFELGHHLISYKNNDYEIEEILSGNGLVKLCAINNIKVNNAGEFFSLVNNKDSLALKILDDYTTLLSKMFYNLQLDYNTDCIVLSGGVMKSIDLFFNELKEKTNALVKKYPLKEVNFVFASFDQDAGLFGGVSLALQK